MDQMRDGMEDENNLIAQLAETDQKIEQVKVYQLQLNQRKWADQSEISIVIDTFVYFNSSEGCLIIRKQGRPSVSTECQDERLNH